MTPPYFVNKNVELNGQIGWVILSGLESSACVFGGGLCNGASLY